MSQEQKIDRVFVGVVRALNNQGITPGVYGSYALLLSGLAISPNDLDFVLLGDDFYGVMGVVNEVMMSLGLPSDPDHSQEFGDGNPWVSFISISDLNQLVGRPLTTEFATKSMDGLDFTLLPLTIYREVYLAGSDDRPSNHDRQERKQSDDRRVIGLIEKRLKQFIAL